MTEHAAAPPNPARATGRRDAMLWLVGGIFAAYLVTNAIMLAFAMRSPPSLVSPSYYEDARGFEAGRDARQASAAAGWGVAVESPSTGELLLRLTDRAGRPASGFSGQASAWRPSDAALDQPLTWQEDAATPGQYRATFSRPRAGQWRIQLNLRRGGERLDHQFRLNAP